MTSPTVRYDGIVRAHTDRDGNLRLYRRRRRLLVTQAIFHPAGEWYSILFYPSGQVVVTLTVRGTEPKRPAPDKLTRFR